jgi:hypothetical protein
VQVAKKEQKSADHLCVMAAGFQRRTMGKGIDGEYKKGTIKAHHPGGEMK